jgi:hypothetical protein
MNIDQTQYASFRRDFYTTNRYNGQRYGQALIANVIGNDSGMSPDLLEAVWACNDREWIEEALHLT